jgi:hypothetical protein
MVALGIDGVTYDPGWHIYEFPILDQGVDTQRIIHLPAAGIRPCIIFFQLISKPGILFPQQVVLPAERKKSLDTTISLTNTARYLVEDIRKDGLMETIIAEKEMEGQALEEEQHDEM